uniref:Uncharacterized protein n=1 Tax=Trichuris muris TaxID=70415 RepID=A0A5S6Q7C0_TRIMR
MRTIADAFCISSRPRVFVPTSVSTLGLRVGSGILEEPSPKHRQPRSTAEGHAGSPEENFLSNGQRNLKWRRQKSNRVESCCMFVLTSHVDPMHDTLEQPCNAGDRGPKMTSCSRRYSASAGEVAPSPGFKGDPSVAGLELMGRAVKAIGYSPAPLLPMADMQDAVTPTRNARPTWESPQSDFTRSPRDTPLTMHRPFGGAILADKP